MTEAGVGTNRYAYSFNDPVNKSDPSGHQVGGEMLATGIGILVQNHLYKRQMARATTLDQRLRITRSHALVMDEMYNVPKRTILEAEIDGRPKTVRAASDILFSQDSIKGDFMDGRSVGQMIVDLESGDISPEALPPVRVFRNENGDLVSLDNRRLYAAREAGVNISTVEAAPTEIQEMRPNRPHNNDSIRVRGVDRDTSGGRRWWHVFRNIRK